ncbi:MAG: hypothetical protein RL885_06260 [Planctomycetota bacterium]
MDRLPVVLWIAALLASPCLAQQQSPRERLMDTTLGTIIEPEIGVQGDSTFSIPTAWAEKRPVIDGVVDISFQGEGWDEFAWGPIDVSRLHDGSVLAWYLSDCTHLYIGIIDFNSVNPNSHEIGLYFDDATPTDTVGMIDDQWNGACEGPPHTTEAAEGNFWLSKSLKDSGGDVFRQWAASAPSSLVCGVFPYEQPASGILSVHGVTSGSASIEIRIDLRSSALNGEPGDVIGLRQYVLDKASGVTHGLYPATSVFDDPATYAEIDLSLPYSATCGPDDIGVNLAGDPSLVTDGAQFVACGFPADEVGDLGIVLLSASGKDGIPLPSSGGCVVPLTADTITTLGLGLQVVLSGTVQGPGLDRSLNSFATPLLPQGSLTVPGFSLYASAIVLDTAGGTWGSVTRATQFVLGSQ